MQAATFDGGGILPPGYTLAYNGTGMPERVISFAEGGMGQWYGGPGYGFVGPQGELPGPWFAKDTTIPSLAQSPLREVINAVATAALTPQPSEVRVLAPPMAASGGSTTIDESVNIASGAMVVEVHVPVGADEDHLSRIVRREVGWTLAQWQQHLQQQLRVRIRV